MVRCQEFQNCKKTDCPHYKEHEPYEFVDYIGGDKTHIYFCFEEDMTCGLVRPYKQVRCAEVIRYKELKRELAYA